MSLELVAKNGLISKTNVFANSYTSSLTASVGFVGTASWAISSSNAITASYSLNGGAGGSAGTSGTSGTSGTNGPPGADGTNATFVTGGLYPITASWSNSTTGSVVIGISGSFAGQLGIPGFSYGSNVGGWYQIGNMLQGINYLGTSERIIIDIFGGLYFKESRTRYYIGGRSGVRVHKIDYDGGVTGSTLKIYKDLTTSTSSIDNYVVGIKIGSGSFYAISGIAYETATNKYYSFVSGSEPSGSNYSDDTPVIDVLEVTCTASLSISSSYSTSGSYAISASFALTPAGTSGTSGTSGTNGPPGITGAAGSSGTSGTSGAAGATGATGAAGSSGTSGTSGANGAAGATGAAGSSGSSGSSGANGPPGASGSSGSSGTSGTSGAAGATGATGAAGSSGTSGTSGAAGATGATGPAGSSGTSGTSGANGAAGANGSSGSSGTAGTSGASIVAGATYPITASYALHVVPNAVTLGTDTVGNYVATVSSGDGITVGGGVGENANITVSCDFGSTSTTVARGSTSIVIQGTANQISVSGGSLTAGGGGTATIGLPAQISVTGITGSLLGNADTVDGVNIGTLSNNFITKYSTTGVQLINSEIQDDGTHVGVGGAPNSSYKIFVSGDTYLGGELRLDATTTTDGTGGSSGSGGRAWDRWLLINVGGSDYYIPLYL